MTGERNDTPESISQKQHTEDPYVLEGQLDLLEKKVMDEDELKRERTGLLNKIFQAHEKNVAGLTQNEKAVYDAKYEEVKSEINRALESPQDTVDLHFSEPISKREYELLMLIKQKYQEARTKTQGKIDITFEGDNKLIMGSLVRKEALKRMREEVPDETEAQLQKIKEVAQKIKSRQSEEDLISTLIESLKLEQEKNEVAIHGEEQYLETVKQEIADLEAALNAEIQTYKAVTKDKLSTDEIRANVVGVIDAVGVKRKSTIAEANLQSPEPVNLVETDKKKNDIAAYINELESTQTLDIIKIIRFTRGNDGRLEGRLDQDIQSLVDRVKQGDQTAKAELVDKLFVVAQELKPRFDQEKSDLYLIKQFNAFLAIDRATDPFKLKNNYHNFAALWRSNDSGLHREIIPLVTDPQFVIHERWASQLPPNYKEILKNPDQFPNQIQDIRRIVYEGFADQLFRLKNQHEASKDTMFKAMGNAQNSVDLLFAQRVSDQQIAKEIKRYYDDDEIKPGKDKKELEAEIVWKTEQRYNRKFMGHLGYLVHGSSAA